MEQLGRSLFHSFQDFIAEFFSNLAIQLDYSQKKKIQLFLLLAGFFYFFLDIY